MTVQPDDDGGQGTESDGDRIEVELSEAISAVLAQRNEFVLKWVALIETAGPSGARGLWTFTSEQMKAWDVAGLLTHGLQVQQAQTWSAGADEG